MPGVTADKNTFYELIEQAQAAATAYYESSSPLMSDADFDALMDRIETIQQETGWDHAGVLSAVAAGASVGGDTPHPTPMLSLSKTGVDDLPGFVTGVAAAVVVEPKLDGLAVRARYQNGTLTQIVTRGDGTTGEDVTSRAAHLTIAGLPATLPTKATVDVRGEVYMSDADFEVSNDARIAAGKPGFANPRNATAGTLRREEHTYDAQLSFAAYDVDGIEGDVTSYQQRIAQIADWGFGTALALAQQANLAAEATTDANEVLARVAALETARDTLGYPIDGAVVKVDAENDRDRLGSASRHPRWATAVKYAADTAETTVEDVELSIGRTGRLGLRLRVAPTEVGGTTITYAAGHNVTWMQEQGIGTGSKVALYRAGDVIPRAVALPPERQPDGVTAWEPPACCPQCDGEWDKSTLLWRCTSSQCSVTGALEYAVSRDVLDIEGASSAFVAAGIEAGLLNDVADLYDLTEEQIANLELKEAASGQPRLLGTANAAKIYANIQEAKKQPLARHLNSINLRMSGRTMTRRIAAHFGTLDAIRAASVTELAAVEGIGDTKAETLHRGLQERSDVLDRLVQAGITTSQEAADSNDGGAALDGLTVVVTGSMGAEPRLAGLNRTAMNELVEQYGGKASGSVGASTSMLVCGEPGSSKYKKAEERGIPIVTPTEFADKLGL